MNCKEVLPLIPGYLDEELSEAQAGPMRQHLMDCHVCRKALAGEKAFKRWFEVEPLVDVAVPAGFAARVARRAFAGDLGSSSEASGRSASTGSPFQEAPLLRFVLTATALAAGLLLVVSALIFQERLPSAGSMHGAGNERKQDLIEQLNNLQDPAHSSESVKPADGAVLKDMAEEAGDGQLHSKGPKKKPDAQNPDTKGTDSRRGAGE